MRRRIFASVIATALVGAALAHADESLRTIRVQGEGKASAPPDIAIVQTGVVTQGPSAKEALAANNKAMEQVLKVLKDQGIAAKDVQTSQFNIQPIHKHDKEGRTLPEIVAYQVSNQVRVTVRQIPKLGGVLDALVSAGSNQLSGISFGINDPTSVLNEARKRAVVDARNRAQLYAKDMDVRLGKVHTISEQPLHIPEPRFAGRALSADAGGAVPIATGEEEFRVSIHVVFILEDAK